MRGLPATGANRGADGGDAPTKGCRNGPAQKAGNRRGGGSCLLEATARGGGGSRAWASGGPARATTTAGRSAGATTTAGRSARTTTTAGRSARRAACLGHTARNCQGARNLARSRRKSRRRRARWANCATRRRRIGRGCSQQRTGDSPVDAVNRHQTHRDDDGVGWHCGWGIRLDRCPNRSSRCGGRGHHHTRQPPFNTIYRNKAHGNLHRRRRRALKTTIGLLHQASNLLSDLRS